MTTKHIIIGIFAGIVCIVLFAVAWYLTTSGGAQPAGEQANGTTSVPPLPIAGSITTLTGTGQASSTPGAQTLVVPAAQGSAIITNDFLHNGTTLHDTANPGRYLLAGNLGYCVSDQARCQAGPDVSYNIYYATSTGVFGIALLSEPLGQVRHDMETALMGILGISEADMCRLRYYVGTTSYVNETYAGKSNLGFSFCPGATPLPQ